MDSNIDQFLGELMNLQGEAYAVLAAAIARQLDAARLRDDLRAQMATAEEMGQLSPASRRFVLQALAAIAAEAMHQNPPRT
jgi:hypothetical protein